MASVVDIIERLRRAPEAVRFAELCRVCEHYFGEPRRRGGSHQVYKTPWTGDPRVNIQNSNGYAKAYQVKQVLKAIERLEVERGRTDR
ncbi:toxin HicA [Geomonas subterranea]|uniref:Toxin HicA n=1 Tax=Geomonas subterranea TaxID=2847989 RepID=A0ABX8LGA7_9BACT|nr:MULTISPECIES: toxin HicA [Geomonas]QXE91071.1 toxin HicA [Geomonas subterranea]QXM10843.1 toxin HicA [Geomonas subterranea]